MKRPNNFETLRNIVIEKKDKSFNVTRKELIELFDYIDEIEHKLYNSTHYRESFIFDIEELINNYKYDIKNEEEDGNL